MPTSHSHLAPSEGLRALLYCLDLQRSKITLLAKFLNCFAKKELLNTHKDATHPPINQDNFEDSWYRKRLDFSNIYTIRALGKCLRSPF